MNKKRFKIVLAFVLVISLLPVGYSAFSMTGIVEKAKDDQINKGDIVNVQNKKIEYKEEEAIPSPETKEITLDKQPKQVFDISMIELEKDVEDAIRKSDNSKFEKNINNYKRLLVEFNVPKEFGNELGKLIKKGYKLPDIMIAYNFLYDNYGQLKELEDLLKQKESGSSFSKIFNEYDAAHPEYVPKKFDEKYLEDLMKVMSIDDVLIADRLSQKGLKKFEDLIDLKKSGKTWSEINSDLSIINTSEKLPRMSLTSGEVEKCMNDTGLPEKEAMEVLVTTWETGKDYAEVLGKVKNGKKRWDIFAEKYNEKYL